jgi:DNA-directed RNA polymerase subunit RPC12/RpoP
MFASSFQAYKPDPPKPTIVKPEKILKCSTCNEDIIGEKPIGVRDGSGRVFHSGRCLLNLTPKPPKKRCEYCNFPILVNKYTEKYHEKCKLNALA